METGPLKIFAIRDVPRLRYIAEIILGDILGLSWEIVTDKRKIGKNPVLNYSSENIKGSFKIQPHNLLFETGIRLQDPVVTQWKGLPVFFQTPADSDLPFDIFAASFFLITRYEEYSGGEPDEYGRYRASESLAFRNAFLTRPVIDLWSRELAKTILLRFQNIAFKRSSFTALLSVDVDQPFAYLGKDLFRSIGGLIRDVGNKSGRVTERYRTVARGEKDPYDTFPFIFEMIGKYEPEVRWFIPTGDRSRYDRHPSWQNDDYRNLINRISQKYTVGMHPSFSISGNNNSLAGEKERLQSIISGKVNTSRFHFIKIRFPESYTDLLNAGITEDYSMGYPEEPGFRAGIARPFFWFDLAEEKKTKLKVFPFQIMDATLFKYKGLSADESSEVITRMINEIRSSGGVFISIWHNTTLIEDPEWIGWRSTFEKMLIFQQK